MKKTTAYFCTDCGNETPKWMGQCPACKAWNTIAEAPVASAAAPAKNGKSGTSAPPRGTAQTPRKLGEIPLSEEIRFTTGLDELDRVLGGGAVAGSLCLLSGEPGIGKSTLLMQICQTLCRNRAVLYCSGEESPRQLRLRGERLGVSEMLVLSQTDIDDVLASIEQAKPDVVILDSIQTFYRSGTNSAPGSVSQVRECTLALMRLAKDTGVTVFVIGHVNKEGAIAGPKVLEHMVDCVLTFEGDRQLSYRILRAGKNRFGSTREIGVFEMDERGLTEVPNPSAAMLAGRPRGAPGSCVACTVEGSRPLLSEIQALVTSTSFGIPRRTVSGFDYNRAMLLLAVLEKRAGMFVGNMDAYINVVGGMKLLETACDLPLLLAVASSHRDNPLPGDLAAFGEVGLTGELRAVPFAEARLAEMGRLGFKKCILPKQGTQKVLIPEGMEVIRVRTFRDAMKACLG